MRKIAAILLALLLVLGLCACGKKAETVKERDCGVYVTVEADDVYTVSYGTDAAAFPNIGIHLMKSPLLVMLPTIIRLNFGIMGQLLISIWFSITANSTVNSFPQRKAAISLSTTILPRASI